MEDTQMDDPAGPVKPDYMTHEEWLDTFGDGLVYGSDGWGTLEELDFLLQPLNQLLISMVDYDLYPPFNADFFSRWSQELFEAQEYGAQYVYQDMYDRSMEFIDQILPGILRMEDDAPIRLQLDELLRTPTLYCIRRGNIHDAQLAPKHPTDNCDPGSCKRPRINRVTTTNCNALCKGFPPGYCRVAYPQCKN